MIGKPASCCDLDCSYIIYNSSIFMIRFGSMRNLKIQAGFEPVETGKDKYNKLKVKEQLIDIYIRKGGKAKNIELKKMPNLPNISTIIRLFETKNMKTVWEEIKKRLSLIKFHSIKLTSLHPV